MESLSEVVVKLDQFFEMDKLPPDPAFSHRLPDVYEAVGVPWKKTFEAEFCERFTGLMLRGEPTVTSVFCAVLPTPEVLGAFTEQGQPGDLLFTHHPIDFEMGDPIGRKGRGYSRSNWGGWKESTTRDYPSIPVTCRWMFTPRSAPALPCRWR